MSGKSGKSKKAIEAKMVEEKLQEITLKMSQGFETVLGRQSQAESNYEALSTRLSELETNVKASASNGVPDFSGEGFGATPEELQNLILGRSNAKRAKKTSGKSYQTVEHEHLNEGKSFDMPSPDARTGHGNSSIAGIVTAIRSAVKIHDGKQEKHHQFMTTLKSEFIMYGFGHIVSDEESVRQTFREEKPDEASQQNRVMISVLNGAIKVGIVYSKFADVQQSNMTDGRGMFLAVSESYTTANYRSTRRGLKRKMSAVRFDPEEDYSVFKLNFNSVLTEFANLKNKKGRSSALDPEDQVDSLLAKFQDEDCGLPPEQRSKWTSIFTSLEMVLDDDEELTIEEIHGRIEVEIDAQFQTKGEEPDLKGRGTSMAQFPSRGPRRCSMCRSVDHLAKDCPDRPKWKSKPCPAYFSEKGCQYTKDTCYYHHPEEDKPEAKTGVSTSAQSYRNAVEELDISALAVAKATHAGRIAAMKDFDGTRALESVAIDSGAFDYGPYLDEQAARRNHERGIDEWAKQHIHPPSKYPYQPWQ
jgi:hypothetical protein